MKLEVFAILATLLTVVQAHDDGHGVFARHHAHLVQRQASGSSTTSSSATSTSAAPPPASTGSSVAAPPPGATSSGVAGPPAGTTTSVPISSGVATPPAASTPLTYDPNGIPPLSDISVGMPTGTTLAAVQTFTAGAKPSYPGAPPLPTAFVFTPGAWPPQDKIPPTDSDEVAEWMKELDGFDIPDIRPTVDGSCVNDTAAAAAAQQNGWWTCGGWTAVTDRTDCNDKMTWGVSFDDGPAPYTQKILNYLDGIKQTATFYVVGSRVIERPTLLVEEYMRGHEVGVHTWSHHPLTAMTNEQVVAELGWSRKAIKDVLGVTPTSMRPPYGDIDNRVRAIAMAMGMEVNLWTRFNGFSFDTFDWKVAGGTVTAPDQLAQFESILGNATLMDRGFVVLEHDLFEITIDLAAGYTLPAALSHNPPFTLKRVGECNGIPLENMYLESTTNKTFPFKNSTAGSQAGNGSSGSGPKGAASGGGSSGNSSAFPAFALSMSAVAAGILAVVGYML